MEYQSAFPVAVSYVFTSEFEVKRTDSLRRAGTGTQCIRSALARVRASRAVHVFAFRTSQVINSQRRHSIHVLRMTFDELEKHATLDANSSVLRLHGIEISTVYYRAGYTPTDYLTPTQFNTRFLLERSKAIKCPSIPLQLAGGKKVQQVLAQPGVLERFLGKDHSKEQLNELRDSWMGMWALDEEGGIARARERALGLVLKPQREGGGNNVYKEDIPAFLDTLSKEERQAWIAMELIVPPEGAKNYLIRAGGTGSVETEVVSELGIFGWSLFGPDQVEEKQVGWLVRTKGKDSNEGGVATGFSVLDSIVLI